MTAAGFVLPGGPAAARWAIRGLAIVAGLAAALAHPPFGVLPGLLGYALLLHLVDRTGDSPRPLRSAFLRGWLAGFAYFFVGCWWVAEAFLVDAKGQGWMAPIAIILLPGGLALFWGAAAALYRRWRPASGLLGPIAFAGALTLLEWIRGHLLTGFPWNLPGETWAAGSAMSQFAAVVGAYGLTWITVAAASAFAIPFGEAGRRRGLAAVGASAAVLAALFVFGAVRLSGGPATDPAAPLIRIAQANVEQAKKYDADSFRDIVNRYVGLTARPGARIPDIVVWPEGAIPAAVDEYLAPGAWPLAAIRGALQPGQTLLLGGYRIGGTPARPLYYNSLIALRAEPAGLRVTGLYDKHRLVPFGEFLPAESILAPLGIKNLTRIGDGFSHGPAPAPISLGGPPDVQPLICYEVLFPGLVRNAIAGAAVRPRWIVNVSNDAWYGPTSGPWQHLNIASYRAIENGLPMIRATPTGVSAVIDAFGRTDPGRRLGLGRMDIIDATLPPVLAVTPFSQFGDLWLYLLLILSGLTLRPVANALSGIVVKLRKSSDS